jgi:hypothetical protein
MGRRVTTALSDARRRIVEALAPKLPGRVSPYPVLRFVAPHIWVDQAQNMRWTTVGQNTQLTVVEFPVWLTYDGAEHAQIAGLDDLVAVVWDALDRIRGIQPTGMTSTTVDVGQPDRTYRAAIVTAEATFSARTLCFPDDPPPVGIPSQPVPQLESV